MRRRDDIVPIWLMALAGALTTCLAATSANTAIITVHADGSGDYPTIQAAIDAAVAGDEVVLATGTYTGAGNIDVDPRLTPDGHLRSDSPCIDAGQNPAAPQPVNFGEKSKFLQVRANQDTSNEEYSAKGEQKMKSATGTAISSLLLPVFSVMLAATPAPADVIFVAAGATGANNGASWTDA